jgi:hypothetical protein
MPSKSRPPYHTRVETYGDLEKYVDAFADGHLQLLIVYGPPGVGKSWTVRQRVGKRACTISGNASAFGIYIAACRHCDEPIILDDIDGFTANPQGVRLLKSLCQTDPEKTVSWQSQAAALERENIPRSFTTRSQVAILANSHFVSEDALALEDRGHVLVFDPPPIEVHRKAATWFWDQTVFDFVGKNLHLMARHSFRTYVTAWERKKADLPWQSAVLDRCLSGTSLEVAKLRADSRFKTEEERVRAFIEGGFGCRATYFNHAAKLRPMEENPQIKLIVSSPPSRPEPGNLLELLRRRFGQLGKG